MTLISYPMRVHFADGVLEEALRAEFERQHRRTPLVLFEQSLEGSVFHERLLAGFPRHTDIVPVIMAPGADPYRIVSEARALSAGRSVDAIVAFGSARAIEMGRKCRRALSAGPGARLELYAVPGADGMPDPCRRNLENWRDGLPSIVICDPRVTLGADRSQSQSASVTSLARCLESYLLAAYNPPADGMALDGFLRCIRNIHRLDHGDGIGVRRELMAACLNAMMAQEKGIGPAQLLARELALRPGIDAGAVVRLILPGILAAMDLVGDKPEALRNVMGRGSAPLDDSLRDVLTDLPFSLRLSDMGLSRDDLREASLCVEGRADLPSGAAAAVLESVY